MTNSMMNSTWFSTMNNCRFTSPTDQDHIRCEEHGCDGPVLPDGMCVIGHTRKIEARLKVLEERLDEINRRSR